MSDNPNPALVLDSLEIKNFRAFKHLRIEKLGRVNLIVGKNNVGKSSVLEALLLFAVKGQMKTLMQLLRGRDELREDNAGHGSNGSVTNPDLSALEHLFHGREIIQSQEKVIEIGSVYFRQNNLTIGIVQSEWVDTGLDHRRLRLLSLEEEPSTAVAFPSVIVNVGQEVYMHYPLDQSPISWFRPGRLTQFLIHTITVADNGLHLNDLAAYWDNIVLSDLQNDVLSALRLIAPSANGINMIGSQNGSSDRIPIIKVSEFKSPIPLRSMGEGMNRMFGIALALVNAKDGMLLIDEVDTGLHYSVLPDLWKLIFEVAHRLNVQVFATSHSWDCIQAFQQAATNNEAEEGVLIRLEDRKAGVGAVVFDERDLAIVTREQIEVR